MKPEKKAKPKKEKHPEDDVLVCNIAYCLKRTRLEQLLRVEDAAVEAETDEAQIRRLESGGHYPNLSSVTSLLRVYHKQVSEVFKDYERKPSREEWQDLEKWQKALNRYHKGKAKKKPNVGVQLGLFE